MNRLERLYAHDKWYQNQTIRWTQVGIGVDLEALQALKEKWTAKGARALEKMRELVPHAKSEALDELLVLLKEEPASNFKPGSLRQLRLVMQALGIPLWELTATGLIATGAEVLLACRRQLIDSGVAKADPRVAFIDYVLVWREAVKLVGTYLSPEKESPLILDDGRIHPTYGLHVVPSGRLTAYNPGVLQQPKEIRGMYKARDGHLFVAGDWDSLELRVLGYIAGEASLIADFAAFDEGRGPKIHKLNCSAIFKVPLDKVDSDGPLYRAAKVFCYACLVGDTKVAVLDAREGVAIRNIKPGDWTYAWDGAAYAPTRVKHVVCHGRRPCVKLTVQDKKGRKKTLVLTPDHRMLMRDGSYKEAGVLKQGDRLMSCVPGRLDHTVLSVVPAGEHEVWDLEVEHEAHNFALDHCVFVANCNYGSGEMTVYEQCRKEMPDLSFQSFKICFDNYRRARPRLFQWQREIVRQGLTKKFLESAVMRRRMGFFEPGDEGDEASKMLNFPIQSTANDVVRLANQRIIERLFPDYRSQLRANEVFEQLSQIHDELLFEVPERLAKPFSTDFKAVAEEIPDAAHIWRLPIEVKVRGRWADVKI